MRYLLLRWLILTVAIGVTAWLMPGMEVSGGLMGLVIVALIFGLINALLRPILLLLTCPLIILTLGLFTLVVNAILLWLTAWLTPLLTVDGFWTTFFASLIISIVAAVLGGLVHDESRW